MDTGLSFFGRKDSPRAGLCLSSSPAPAPPDFKCLGCQGAGSKGRKLGLRKGIGALREVRGESQLSNSHSATMNRAMTTPSWWASFQEKNAASYTLSLASLLQMEEWKPGGTGFSGTMVLRW